jgi:glycosyltransferase involved in cell wall biosynthesis
VRQARVLFIINYLLAGGAERHLVELVRRGMGKGRFCADVLCLKSSRTFAGERQRNDLSPELRQIGVYVRDGWLRHKYDVWGGVEVLRLVAMTRPDVVYTHMGINELCLGTAIHGMFGTPTVCAVHMTKQTGAGEHLGSAQRVLLRRASVVVSIAPSHRAYLLASEGLDPSRTIYIQHGVDEVRFHPKRSSRSGCLGELTGRRVIGVVGNLLRDKGHHILLQAMPRVLAEHPDVAVVFAGHDPSPTKEVETALRMQAQQMGLSDRVVFLGYREDVDCVVRGLDIFVLPSLRETFPMAILEAMASGVPVVATQVGSIHEMITDGQEGFLVQPNDGSALADRLNLLLDDPARLHAMGCAGRQRVERQFTLDRMTEEYAVLFDRLAALSV